MKGFAQDWHWVTESSSTQSVAMDDEVGVGASGGKFGDGEGDAAIFEDSFKNAPSRDEARFGFVGVEGAVEGLNEAVSEENSEEAALSGEPISEGVGDPVITSGGAIDEICGLLLVEDFFTLGDRRLLVGVGF